MGSEAWAEVDDFVASFLAPHDEVLEAALRDAERAGLPQIQVSPPQAKMLWLLARTVGARNALELGTLGGYSTIWLARALPAGGRLISLEADRRYAEVAKANVERAGLGDRIEIRVGPALETLAVLEAEDAGPFDLVFIDADKIHTPDYFAWSVERCRPGALIVADNVVRDGTLAEADSEDPTIRAQRRLHELIAADGRVEATTIQTVGVKGYDGFTLAIIN
jgi:predicted O-methyltransferase YrrM